MSESEHMRITCRGVRECESVRAHSPALSPSSLPALSLLHSSAAAPRLRPESNQDSHLYPACHPRGWWAGGVRGCRALILNAKASPKIEDLAVGGGGEAAPGFHRAPNYRHLLSGLWKRHWLP